MNKKETNEKYKMRADAIKVFKKAIVKKGGKMTPLSKKDRDNLTADYRLDGRSVKIKVAKRKNVNILFEYKNDGKVSWFPKTRANLLCMIFVEPKVAYLIPLMAAKDYIAERIKTIGIYKTDTGTRAYEISIETLIERKMIMDTIKW